MLIDEKIRLEATTNVNKSFIVQASAGSGKTSLLVQRFVNLLKISKDPEECLAITFTKKAAGEMLSRVLLALESQTEEICSRVLADPNKLQILTIDAFCAKLTQRMPILSKFGVDLKITDDSQKLYIAAVDRLLATTELPDSKYLIKLLQYLANDHDLIKKLLVDILAKREQWLPLIVPIKLKQNFNLQKVLENNLQHAITIILDDLLNYLPKTAEVNKIIHLAKYAANNLDDFENNIIHCKLLTDSWPKANYVDLPIWRGLAELLLNKNGEARSIVNAKQGFVAASNIKNKEEKFLANQCKSDMHELLKNLKKHNQQFLLKLQQISILPDPVYDVNSLEILENLFFLLPELVAHLMLVFEEQQEVDFTQIAIAALDAMGTEDYPTDLALVIDYKLNHILVDEFQDTSQLQFNLLEKLVANWHNSDGKTIFFVGDPIQSIYRFRQANVELFLKVQKHGIGNVELKNLYLKTNFRSSKSIVTNLNQLFSKIFPGSYNLAEAYDQENTINNDVQFFSTHNAELEALHIVDLIKKIKQDNSQLSVAVLVRVKQHAKVIIKTLLEQKIPYQAHDIESLANQAVICDLVSLTRAILHVNDTIAWLALFRGPLVGLKLIDLYALFEQSKSGSLFNKLKNYQHNAELSEDAMIRLNYILPILFEAIENRETIVLSKLIKKTWRALGGDLLLNSNDEQLVENFFNRLLDLKDIFEIGGVDALIQKHFVLFNQEHDNFNKDKIQLMTIHKAKGLEFDIVIVPSMDKSSKNIDNSLFLWEERANNCLLFAPIKSAKQQTNAIYNFIKHSEEQHELQEAKRLLYVAITRAKKKFYGFTSGTISRHKSFLKFLESHINFVFIKQAIANSIINIENNKVESVILQRIPTKWYVKKIGELEEKC